MNAHDHTVALLDYILVLQGLLGLVAVERWLHHKRDARQWRSKWGKAMSKLRHKQFSSVMIVGNEEYEALKSNASSPNVLNRNG